MKLLLRIKVGLFFVCFFNITIKLTVFDGLIRLELCDDAIIPIHVLFIIIQWCRIQQEF